MQVHFISTQILIPKSSFTTTKRIEMNKQQSNLIGIRYKPDIEKWEARISIKNQSHSKTFQKLEEAIEWRKNKEEQKSSCVFFTCSELFAPWLESLKNDVDLSPQTHSRYENMCRLYIAPFFKSMLLKDITNIELINFVVHLKELKRKTPLAAKTIKNMIAALSNFFEYCSLRNYIPLNPVRTDVFKQNCSRLIRERKNFAQNIKEKARTIEEIRLLIAGATHKSLELGIIVEFLFLTGLRLGEAAALTWGDVQTHHSQTGIQNTILVNKTRNLHSNQIQTKAKCGSDGMVRIPKSLFEKLSIWMTRAQSLGYGVDKSDFIFPRLSTCAKSFTKMLSDLSKKVGVRKTTSHCLRHSYVTFLATSGHNLQQVQLMSRHKDINATMTYYAAANQSFDPMVLTLDAALSNLPSHAHKWDKALG